LTYLDEIQTRTIAEVQTEQHNQRGAAIGS